MLLCLSASHRSADFSVLEKLSAADRTSVDRLLSSVDGIDGGVVLSTCNRFELYLEVSDADELMPRLYTELSRVLGAPVGTLRDQLAVVRGDHVPEYLFSVTSGLESVVVGEGEISGQVRRALDDARGASLTTSRLEQLFQRASTTSRSVKHGTGLQTAGRSLVRLALDLAESQITDWSRARVLLVGTGNYAAASLKALRDRGVQHVGTYSPSGRANRFAERQGVDAVSDSAYLEAAASADLIVTCSNVEEPVLDHAGMQAARMAPGRALSTLVIDLGMPRNVDPMVGRLDGVDLLDLETIRRHAPLDELTAADEARCIVARAAAEFRASEAEAEVHHAITAFRSHVVDIAEREVERVGDRLGDEGALALRRLANQILHQPSARAKQLAREGRGQEFVDAIELLFGVTVPELEPGAAQRPEAQACPYLASLAATSHEVSVSSAVACASGSVCASHTSADDTAMSLAGGPAVRAPRCPHAAA
ncbi:glutamyl-tRNA reductase [Pseudoclavibacter endophyticus]|uniref:Glutamyl-tRNA reductase n=1 Tax=Pseudoclavibacter endophyticus TaxID=1778590 RepID=A0A6H9WR54_9MICO|nr:glutamyl-tRNA reductase [Pseudoclavibacter endophyticus]KAB1648794.1 glutamyl-tRNA reductase [Pseudoclavibacter endophyticus]GGA68470.1 glutamyl-tRNA reductase [Pseudoclavibacter endophyticus]